MPIVVKCPKCPTKLSAPESAAGKAVRCPKCGAAAPVPAFVAAEEVPVVEAAVATPKPKPKPKPVDDDDDEPPRKKAPRDEDDEDEDDRPRKKKKRRYDDDDDDEPPRRKRRKKAGGGNGGIIALVVVGALLLLGGVGFGIYALTGKGSPFAKKTPVPDGWKEFSYPNDGFKAYFPAEPQVVSMPGGNLPAGRVGGLFGGESVEMTSVSAYSVREPGGIVITLSVARFKNDIPRAMRNELDKAIKNKGGLDAKEVRWVGEDAIEIVMGQTVMRYVYTDDLLIMAQVTGANGARAKPEEEAAFFDNFELTD